MISKLYILCKSCRWQEAMELLKAHPEEASKMVVTGKRGAAPISAMHVVLAHANCRGDVPVALVRALLDAAPHLAMQKHQYTGNLALHAVFYNAFFSSRKRTEIASLLIRACACECLVSKNNDGRTPLHTNCSQHCNYEPILLLLEKAPQVAAWPDENGDLPLHLACKSLKAPNKSIAAIAAAYPKGLWMKNKDGMTPLDIAKHDNSSNGGFVGAGYGGSSMNAKKKLARVSLLEKLQKSLGRRLRRCGGSNDDNDDDNGGTSRSGQGDDETTTTMTTTATTATTTTIIATAKTTQTTKTPKQNKKKRTLRVVSSDGQSGDDGPLTSVSLSSLLVVPSDTTTFTDDDDANGVHCSTRKRRKGMKGTHNIIHKEQQPLLIVLPENNDNNDKDDEFHHATSQHRRFHDDGDESSFLFRPLDPQVQRMTHHYDDDDDCHGSCLLPSHQHAHNSWMVEHNSAMILVGMMHDANTRNNDVNAVADFQQQHHHHHQQQEQEQQLELASSVVAVPV